ncbi:hypothetical protein FAEPRAM212_00112 [Faecalibacterium prausnitzii M21/2]|uniref:Uncharacterized protein n=1 Tax=Faecalibacterium prausnitzii M21/2 TaxID=411485 RepID=A8S685_9FIRM|nr:hypothetical protein FAEPRAM212_00112 [Faecalibacterium prausnitzii M21/2]
MGFLGLYVGQTAEMNAQRGQILQNPFSFAERSGIMPS